MTVSSHGSDGEDDRLSSLVHLSSAGVSVLIQLSPVGLPVVLHWGADLGDLTGLEPADVLTSFSSADHDHPESRPSILPTSGPGWTARPGVLGGRSGRRAAMALTVRRVYLVSGVELADGLTQTGPDTLVVEAADPAGELGVDLAVQLTEHGLVRGRVALLNQGSDPYAVDGVELFLPVDERATHRIELDAMTGRRATPLGSGSLLVETWANETQPAELTVGESGTRFRLGPVWQAHVAFSGAVRHRCERTASGRTYLGGGEQLSSGEVVLGPGESYHSPWLWWNWADGLDAAAARVHDHHRARSAVDRPPRPVIFDAAAPAFADHDQTRLLQVADYAAAVGAEAFMINVEWCTRHGLDPWTDVSTGAPGASGLAHDLEGLLARIRDLDLTPGFALEPELVDPDSAIVREHPEWLVSVERADQPRLVLDLSIRPAMVHVWERLTKLLDRHPVGVLAWRAVADRRGGVPNGHARTLAVYRLLDALRERYPQLELQAPGLDLGMAPRASGTDAAIDAAHRFAELAGLTQLRPPELVFSPVRTEPDAGAATGFRLLSGFFGALGLSLDLTQQSPANLRSIHRWLALHKSFRDLLHRGRTVRSDRLDRQLLVHGVVDPGQAEALFAVVWLDRTVRDQRIRIEGLDPATRYAVEVIGTHSDTDVIAPSWAAADPALADPTARRLTGAALAVAGLPVRAAAAGAALLIYVRAELPLD